MGKAGIVSIARARTAAEIAAPTLPAQLLAMSALRPVGLTEVVALVVLAPAITPANVIAGPISVRRQDPAVEVFILARLRLISAVGRLLQTADGPVTASTGKAAIVGTNVCISGATAPLTAANRLRTGGRPPSLDRR